MKDIDEFEDLFFCPNCRKSFLTLGIRARKLSAGAEKKA
jgi:hypothetical protein